MRTVGDCEFCGHAVPEQQAAFPITGWEALRDGGGANRVIGRTREKGRVAHARCAEDQARRLRRGIADEQGSLDL